MNNLKRVLSLALSGIMLVGMMAVGASAADFSDADKIEHADAVNTLVALNIINGQDDGSFNPEGDVTRAQMAKMIAVAMNGGKETTTGTKTNPTFTDIKGHWAESYIEFCADLKIISGRGDGTFDPEGKVTGLEAAKMVLTALGYDADAYQLKGATWATRTDELAKAGKPSLYTELNGSMAVSATRDVAAQLIWNGLQNKTMTVKPSNTLSDGTITWSYEPGTKSLLSERYNAVVEEGFLTAVEYDKDSKEYTYTIDGSDPVFGAEALEDDVADNTFKSTEDLSALYGQKVKVVYKDNKSRTVYGITASGSSVLATVVAGKDLALDADKDSIKVNGTTYKFANKEAATVGDEAADIDVYVLNNKTAVGNLNTYGKGATVAYAVDLIDNDDDGKINVAVAHPILVGEVTYVGKNSITAGNKSYKFDDCDIYEKVAVDDWAVVTPAEYTANGKAVVAKAEVISGEITATRNGGDDIKVGDTWYVRANASIDVELGTSYDVTVVNGYIFAVAEAEDTTVSASNVLLVVGKDTVAEDDSLDAGTQALKVMFSDGSTKRVVADKLNDKDIREKTVGTEGQDGYKPANSLGDDDVDVLYTYKTDKDGNYELKDIDASKFDEDGTVSGAAVALKDGKITISGSTFRFEDNAAIFVKAGTKYDVVDGKTVNDWKDLEADVDSVFYAKDRNGFHQTTLAFVDLKGETSIPGVKGSEKYGWVTGAPALIKSGDDYFIEVTIWDGSEEFTALVEGTAANTSIGSNTEVKGDRKDVNVQKGTPISFKDLGNDHVDEVTSLKSSADAVTAYNNGKAITFATAGDLEITKDTVIVYVDTENNEGVEGGSITIAQKTEADTYVKNVYAAQDGTSGDVKYIIVDTANNLDENSDDSSLKTLPTGLTKGEKNTLVLADAANIAVNNGVIDDLAATSADATIVVKAAGAKLAVDDTIMVIAADGSVTTYTVVAAPVVGG